MFGSLFCCKALPNSIIFGYAFHTRFPTPTLLTTNQPTLSIVTLISKVIRAVTYFWVRVPYLTSKLHYYNLPLFLLSREFTTTNQGSNLTFITFELLYHLICASIQLTSTTFITRYHTEGSNIVFITSKLLYYCFVSWQFNTTNQGLNLTVITSKLLTIEISRYTSILWTKVKLSLLSQDFATICKG